MLGLPMQAPMMRFLDIKKCDLYQRIQHRFGGMRYQASKNGGGMTGILIAGCGMRDKILGRERDLLMLTGGKRDSITYRYRVIKSSKLMATVLFFFTISASCSVELFV